MDPQNHNYLTDCPRCAGTGHITGEPPDNPEPACPVCKGSGGLDADVARYIHELQDEVLRLLDRLSYTHLVSYTHLAIGSKSELVRGFAKEEK